MKLYGILCVTVAIVMILSPIVALTDTQRSDENEKSSVADTGGKTESASEKSDTISVFLSEDNQTEQMDIRDYVIGVVAAEMPASYEAEALKAQALVAVTYAEYTKLHEKDEGIGGADVSDDSNRHQGYLTQEQMKEKWGDAYEECYQNIANAVDAVIEERIKYNGEIILPAYHAISSGQTETAANIWGNDIPYLQSADSEWDKDSTRFESQVTVTAEELKQLMGDKNAFFDEDESAWIEIKEVSEAETVISASVCGVEMTGLEIRDLLALRSPSFTVEYADGEFVFTVSGYGHGVGMSQNGANQMAKEGYTYDEIIAHYYSGVEIL